ncbi:uncharacterized protein LOC129769003 isoform X2 [Toxorhynchites rutilus septentrionalis]|uniref:uncharacterized protein LOC129769003 isoform X2 n=1 Tax=Toxorhynchites rutilus septentrionalis TaxID=329112 RepID=UPI0024792F69|nr:uncharacterized protein LOC129769003 isoform X2 [Toxorhynchites rutilus septentrionalis]
MASSLKRIFASEIDPFYCDEIEHEDGGSDTTSIPDEDNYLSMNSSKKQRSDSGLSTLEQDFRQQRNPTRRPNPKISNRNALLARENRKRKKQHVESLEKQVEQLKQRYDIIRMALKRKSKLVMQLSRERNYLRSVIANRTGIMSVLRSVQRTGLSMTSSQLSYVTGAPKTPGTGSSCDEGICSSPQMALFEDEERFNSNDLGVASEHVSFEDEFSRLPDMEELMSAMTGGSAGNNSAEKVINTEHNYSEYSNQSSLESGGVEPEDGGVCIHIVPGGIVSVEFCAFCAQSSRRARIEDAEER